MNKVLKITIMVHKEITTVFTVILICNSVHKLRTISVPTHLVQGKGMLTMMVPLTENIGGNV